MARRASPGGLAGWLFADLALVLAFVFLNSKVTGSDTAAVVTSTTSTTVVVGTEPVKGGADPEPIEVVVRMDRDSSGAELVEIVEFALTEIENQEQSRRPFLVVLLYGGSKGAPNEVGRSLARRAEELLKESWRRVIVGQTYFVPASDEGREPGTLQLKLFPVTSTD